MNLKSEDRPSGTKKANFVEKFLANRPLWQKFSLLGLVGFALLSYPVYNTLSTNFDLVKNVQTEQAALPSLRTVEDLIQALQDHRTAGSYFVAGDSARSAPRAKAVASADGMLESLSKQFSSIDNPVLLRNFDEVRQEWALLKSNVDARKLDSREVVVKHTALINRAIGLIPELTAHFQIDLDPDAAAYYAFRATLFDLPQIKESIRALRSPVTDRLEALARARKTATEQPSPAGFNLDTALRQAMRADDRARFLNTIEQAEKSARSYADNMRRAMAASPTMKTSMVDQVAQIAQLTEQGMQYARRELLSQEFPSLDPAVYQKEVSVSREAAIKASEQSEVLLTDALNNRLSNARRELLVQLGGLAALLVIGLGIAVMVVRNITGTVRNLQGSIDQVREGNFDVLQDIESKDEVGQLGRTVNALLQDRITAQGLVEADKQKAEDENERLNNSVISILQAVNQLSQRDLTTKAPVTQDVIGTVSDSINALTDETVKVLHGVSAIAGQVAQGSGKVKAQADLVSQTAADERESVQQMIGSLADATQSMGRVAVLAEQSNKSAEQATQATGTALETVNNTVKGMESIRETIAETEKRIKRLGERSQEITGIVNLINTISERTHVLALNASMQAAVAGEAGRGFAVVAEEVQRLAESSRNATQQIGTLVSNIQLETNETINTVNRTIGQVVQGSEQAQKAGEQMRRTQEITAQLVAQVQRIAEGSEEQKRMTEQLLKSVQNIGASTERTAQQIGAQNEETDALLLSSRQLVDSVNVFKLPRAA